MNFRNSWWHSIGKNLEFLILLAISIRLFSIFLFVLGLNYAAQMISFFADEESVYLSIILISFPVSIFAISILLWLFPNIIAKKIYPSKNIGNNGFLKFEKEILDSNKSSFYANIYNCGFVLMGTYLLFSAITDGLYWHFILWPLKIAMTQILSLAFRIEETIGFLYPLQLSRLYWQLWW